MARVFEQAGADRLCVASLDEALALRDAGIAVPILDPVPDPAGPWPPRRASGFEIVAADGPTTAATLLAVAHRPTQRDGSAAERPVEVETGSGARRLQAGRRGRSRAADRGDASARTSRACGRTWRRRRSEPRHDAQDDSPSSAPLMPCVSARARRAAAPPCRDRRSVHRSVDHCTTACASALALYGLLPDGFPMGELDRGGRCERLRPAMASSARPLRVETFPAGTPVGLRRPVDVAGASRASRRCRSAMATAGSRSYSPGAEALVRGRRVPLVGTVAMDAVMADVTDVAGCGHWRMSSFCLGRQGDEQITAKRAGARPQHHSLGSRNEHVFPITPGVPCRLGTNGAPDIGRRIRVARTRTAGGMSGSGRG